MIEERERVGDEDREVNGNEGQGRRDKVEMRDSKGEIRAMRERIDDTVQNNLKLLS